MDALKLILLIEDEHDIQEITKSALELVGGFSVESAYNGQQGIDKAKQYKPDLILLDVMMPGMDGATTFKLLREQDETKDIPIIFMTAKVQKSEIEYYIKLGAVDVIPKPFDPMQISEQINNIWARIHAE